MKGQVLHRERAHLLEPQCRLFNDSTGSIQCRVTLNLSNCTYTLLYDMVRNHLFDYSLNAGYLTIQPVQFNAAQH